MLPTPGFHHLHLNSVDPDAAIDFYTRQFPSTPKGELGRHGRPSNRQTTSWYCSTRSTAPPPTCAAERDLAFRLACQRFAGHRRRFQGARRREDAAALYERGGRLGADQQRHLAEHRQHARPRPGRRSPRPRRTAYSRPDKGGFAYMSGGPEDALFEIAGDYPAERFNHVHMWHEQPFCALLWYKKHLNAPVRAGFPDTELSEDNCRVERGADRTWPALNREGMFRTPRAGVEFGDVVLTWYANQGQRAARPQPRPDAGPYRPLRRRSRCLGREAQGRRRQLPRRPLQARRHPRGDDRRPEPRGDRAGRGEVVRSGKRRILRDGRGDCPRDAPRADPRPASSG